MKKLMLAATLAALTFGAAQAVAVDWDWGKSALSQSGTVTSGSSTGWTCSTAGTYTGNASFAARVTYTLPDGGSLKNGAAWMELFGFDNAGIIYSLQTNGQKQVGLFVDSTGTGNMTADNLSALMANGTLTLVLEYDDAAGTLAVYANDTLVTTATGVEINDWVTFRAGQSSRPLDREFPDGTAYTFELTTERTALIPEPTALALLALGVAGVALRRRVA